MEPDGAWPWAVVSDSDRRAVCPTQGTTRVKRSTEGADVFKDCGEFGGSGDQN